MFAQLQCDADRVSSIMSLPGTLALNVDFLARRSFAFPGAADAAPGHQIFFTIGLQSTGTDFVSRFRNARDVT
ncbi:MAG: hypothetical protein ACJAWZ_003722, partial [Paracoccaceae bacterium]